MYYRSEPFWHAPMYYRSEPFWHAPIYVESRAILACTHNHSEPFRHAPMYYHSEPFWHAPMYYRSEPFWHAPIYVESRAILACTHNHSEPFWHAPMYYHSEPFWHAPMYYRSEPFWHAPTCGIASHSAAIIVSPPMTPAHALLRVYREQLLQRMAFKYVRFRKRVIIYLLLFSLFPSPEKDNDPGEQAECRKACRCSSYRCTLVIARTIARLGFIPPSLR